MRELRKLDLADCPRGRVLCPACPNEAINRYFRDWVAPLAHPARKIASLLSAREIDGKKVLYVDMSSEPENRWGGLKYDSALLTKELVPADVKIGASVMLLSDVTRPTEDNMNNHHSLAGLVARCVDIRHYYQFGLYHPGRLVLIRRADISWPAWETRSKMS